MHFCAILQLNHEELRINGNRDFNVSSILLFGNSNIHSRQSVAIMAMPQGATERMKATRLNFFILTAAVSASIHCNPSLCQLDGAGQHISALASSVQKHLSEV